MANNTINARFIFRGNAQSGEVNATRLFKGIEDVANFVIQDVVLEEVSTRGEEYKQLFERELAGIVSREAENLAMIMNKALFRPNSADGPQGNMSPIGARSESTPQLAYELAGKRGIQMRAQDFGIKWAPRSPVYLNRKAREGRPAHWFRHQDALRAWVDGGMTKSFGPIEAQFTRTDKGKTELGTKGGYTGVNRGADGRFRSNKSTLSKNYITRRPGRASGGATGPAVQQPYNLMIGRLEVSAFQKITPSMLPALERGETTKLRESRELIGLLPEEIQDRLAPRAAGTRGGEKPFRYTVEPFLSWFLTKAVPFVVASRIGQVLKAQYGSGNSPLTTGDTPRVRTRS